MKRGGPLKRYTPLRKVRLGAKPKKTKATTASKLKKVLWKIFSEYIRRRNADENGMATCVSCQTTAHWKTLQAGHFVSRSLGLNTFFDEQNVHPQCFACNIWRRGNIASYALFMVNTYGPGILAELDARRQTQLIVRTPWYLEQIAAYKTKLNALEKK